jgi:hypothetical protein
MTETGSMSYKKTEQLGKEKRICLSSEPNFLIGQKSSTWQELSSGALILSVIRSVNYCQVQGSWGSECFAKMLTSLRPLFNATKVHSTISEVPGTG